MSLNVKTEKKVAFLNMGKVEGANLDECFEELENQELRKMQAWAQK